MCTRPVPPGPSRRGVSLLEVLISIGILSIGLLATLSLIPAGRTYMHKAAIDDRAAAMAAAAFETISVRGLLTTTAASWVPFMDGTFTDPEKNGVVIREQKGKDVTNPALYPGNTGSTRDELWDVQTVDTASITSYYDRSTPFTTLTGTVNPGTPSVSRTVTITSSPASTGPSGSVSSNATTGRWTLSIDSSLLPLAAPDMQIDSNGTPTNSYWTDYTFTARYTDSMGTPQTSTTTPASPYRQYGRLRQVQHNTGYATTSYTAPANAITDVNDTSSTASLIPMTTLLNASPGGGRNLTARSVTKILDGSMWRMTLGTVRNAYVQDVDYANTVNAPAQPRTPQCQNKDITIDAGAFVSGPTTLDDDLDWFQLPVSASEIIRVRDAGSSTGSLIKDPQTNTRYFPAYFNSAANLLQPMPTLSDADYYFIPADGTLYLRAALDPTVQNTFSPANYPRTGGAAPRANPTYKLDIVRLPTERTVIIDPLMATRIDKIIASQGNGALNANLLRRQRFADFMQSYATGGTQQRIIPRLNWMPLASNSIGVDDALAVAERLFQDTDSLTVDASGDADTAPVPLFDVSDTNQTVRRQVSGRMSWMLMLQPQDPGPAAVNWKSGKWFDVNVVIFEDRELPALANTSFTGEYALDATWSDLDGTLTVKVPASTTNMDDEEVRRLFRTGAWLLLAPKVIDGSVSPLQSTQRLDWVKIQSTRIGADSSGVRTASILLESEPSDVQTLHRTLQATAPNYQLVVLAYGGVVAVVNRSVQLE